MPGRQSLLRVYGRYNYILFFLFLICTAQPTLSVAQFTKVHCKRTGQEKQERSTYRSATLRVAFSLFFFVAAGVAVVVVYIYLSFCFFHSSLLVEWLRKVICLKGAIVSRRFGSNDISGLREKERDFISFLFLYMRKRKTGRRARYSSIKKKKSCNCLFIPYDSQLSGFLFFVPS